MVTTKETILEILKKQFGDTLPDEKLNKAAEALLSANDEWEEVIDFEPELGLNFTDAKLCEDICYLAAEIKKGTQFRLLKKKI